MTFVREDGQRVTRAWQLPRTPEDLSKNAKWTN